MVPPSDRSRHEGIPRKDPIMKTRLWLGSIVLGLAASAVHAQKGGMPAPAGIHATDANVAAAVAQLQTMRAQIELYTVMQNGAAPDFRRRGWQPLVDAELIAHPPTNPLVAPAVAKTIVVIDRPGAEGDVVSARKAGWVWNAADKKLYLDWKGTGMTKAEYERARNLPRGAVEAARSRVKRRKTSGQ